MLEPLQGPQPGPRCACPLLKAWVSQTPPGPLVCGGDRIKVKLRGCSQVSGTMMFLGLLWGPWGRVSPLGAGLPSQNGSSRSWAAQGFHSFLPGPAAPTKARLSGVDARSLSLGGCKQGTSSSAILLMSLSAESFCSAWIHLAAISTPRPAPQVGA